MRLAVKLYRAVTDKPTGIPDDWPADVREIGDTDAVPSGYTGMTQAEYDAHRATHQAAYDTWLAAVEQAKRDTEAAKQADDDGEDAAVDQAIQALVNAQLTGSTQLGLTTVQLRRVLIYLLRVARFVARRFGRR